MANNPKGLGKGLAALLGDDVIDSQEEKSSLFLPISQVESCASQPRKQFDPESLADLADSIREHGIIQPLTVRKLQSGYYQIIAGERRWRAARMAGLTQVPAIVIEADDRKAMAREFGAFVTCRLGTMLLDTAIMLVLGNLLAAQGAALMDELMQGVLSVVAHWLGPDTAIQMAASYAGTPAGVTDGSAAIAVIGGADGPTAIFVTSRYNAQALWGLAVKVFSNVLVIVLNYVFSKLIIFKNRK